MLADGSNGSVEFAGDRITIRRKGLANVLTQGLQGDKTIPTFHITAIQFRPAGKWMAGLIQFTLAGGREFRGGMMEATKDENAVMFTIEQQPAFEALRDTVQDQIRRPTLTSPPVASGIGDLMQLADLLERGHITKDEFDASKRNILAGTAAIDRSVVPDSPLPESMLGDFEELTVPPNYTLPSNSKSNGFGKGCLWAGAIAIAILLIFRLSH